MMSLHSQITESSLNKCDTGRSWKTISFCFRSRPKWHKEGLKNNISFRLGYILKPLIPWWLRFTSSFGENTMNALRKPWYLSLIIYLIWEIYMNIVEYFPFIARHRPLCQFEYKYIEFRRLLQLSFFP